MVVGMKEPLPQPLISSVGNHLVDVHVCLGAAARLPHHQGEVLQKLPRQHLVANRGDGLPPPLVQAAQADVHLGGGLFQDGEGPEHLLGHPFPADGEIFNAPLGLRPPVFTGGDLHFPHGVVLDAVFHSLIPPFAAAGSAPGGPLPRQPPGPPPPPPAGQRGRGGCNPGSALPQSALQWRVRQLPSSNR